MAEAPPALRPYKAPGRHARDSHLLCGLSEVVKYILISRRVYWRARELFWQREGHMMGLYHTADCRPSDKYLHRPLVAGSITPLLLLLPYFRQDLGQTKN